MQRSDIDLILQQMNGLTEAAKQDVRTVLLEANARGFTPAEMRDVLLDVFRARVGVHADAAAAAAAQWYEALRYIETGDEDYTVQLPPAYTADELEAHAREIAGRLFGDEGALASTLVGIGERIDRLVKGAARDTLIGAAENDPKRPRYARVPAGAETCAFCRMLASRGWVYSSEQAARGVKGSYHPNCDCVPTPAWGKNTPRIEGYDPEEDYERYRTARQSAAAEHGHDIGLSDWDIAKEMENLYPALYGRAAKTAKDPAAPPTE